MQPDQDTPHRPTLSDTRPKPPARPAAPTEPTLPVRPKKPRPPQDRRLLVLFGILGAIALVVVVALVAALIALTRTMPVTVVVEGSAYQTQTRANTVDDLLRQLQIALNDGDTVSPPLDSPITSDLVIRIERARTVTLTVDGQSQLLLTPLTNPADILNSVGLTAGDTDRVLVDGSQANPADLPLWPIPATRILLKHAIPLQIDDAGQERTVHTTSDTVGDALFDAGITVYLADQVTPELNTPISAGLQVRIQRSIPVSIIADGAMVKTRTQGKTVADALSDAGIALLGLDYTVPSEAAPLQPGIVIRIIHVREETVVEQQTLPFDTIYQGDPALELDQTQLAQAGQPGLQEARTRIRYENGVEVSRQAEGTLTVQPAQNRIISYGTNIVLRTLDTPSGPVQYWRVIRMYATSYSPKALGGDNITATGRTLTTGIVGIDPTVIPYGTQIYVPGYGVGVAADTGGPRSTHLWIDLGYSDDEYRPWSQYVEVYILAPVPDHVEYTLPP
jgi:resuscitation-promoting factor RpfB